METKIACILKAKEMVFDAPGLIPLEKSKKIKRNRPITQNTYAYGVKTAKPSGFFLERTTALW